MTQTTKSTQSPPLADLRPDFATEQDARAAGYRLVTSAFLLPVERELAELVLAGFQGKRPGHTAVRVAVVGDQHRVAFARPASDLRGLEMEPHTDNHKAGVAEPMLLPDAA